VTGSTTSSALEKRVFAALGRVIDPEIRRPVTELDMIDGVHVTLDASGATRADVQLRLTIVGCPAADRIERDVRAAARWRDEARRVRQGARCLASCPPRQLRA